MTIPLMPDGRSNEDEQVPDPEIASGASVDPGKTGGDMGTTPGDVALEAKLTPGARNRLGKRSFAEPGRRGYPIPDKAHARNALSRVAQHGSESEKKKVHAAVCRRFPSVGSCKEGLTAAELVDELLGG